MMAAFPLHTLLLVMVFSAQHHWMPVTAAPNASMIKDMLTSHFSKPRHHVTNPQYKMAARAFIQSQFEDMGMTVVNHNFTTVEDGVEGVNIIGVLKGANFSTENDSLIAISAHYDTQRNTPGVNDNGASVAVMLEAARQISLTTPRTSTVLFIAFDFEEGEDKDGAACIHSTCGSWKLLEEWLPSYFQHWPDLPWRGLANMDIILNFDERKNTQKIPEGFTFIFPEEIARLHADQREGDFLIVSGRSPEDLQLIKDFNVSWHRQGSPNFELEAFPIESHVLGYASDLKRSDHAQFWLKNVSAIFLTDTANYRGYMTRCYHEACDNLTYVTDDKLLFAEKLSKALVSWVDLRAPEYGSSAVFLVADKLSTLAAAVFVILTSQGIPRQ